MEIVIMICLLILIVLLLRDKINLKKKPVQMSVQEIADKKLPDIMGMTKPAKTCLVPMVPKTVAITETEAGPEELDIEYDVTELVGIQVLKEDMDEVFSNMPDFEKEEEDFKNIRAYDNDIGLATGVTFEELSSVGMLLCQDQLDPAQKLNAVAIVQKIQGTELFSLLESSMDGASSKIARLLESSFSSDKENGSSYLAKDLSDFDIGEFV